MKRMKVLKIEKEKNLYLTTRVNELTEELVRARDISKNWEGSQKVLNFLKSQTTKCDKTSGLGFKWNSQSDCTLQKLNPSDTDYRKRKYVGLPEHLTCNYCGTLVTY